MATQTEYKVKNLVDFPREITADDTLREFQQYVRLQLVKDDQGRLDHLQLLFDRRFKLKPTMSKPLGYVHFSTATQLLNLAIQGICGATILNLAGRDDLSPTVISTAIDGAVEFVLQDSKRLTAMALEALKK